MSDELREILEKVENSGYYSSDYLEKHNDQYLTVNDAIEKINAWHIRERKKWAISRKPEGQNTLDLYKSQEFRKGYNQALADYVKNIEED